MSNYFCTSLYIHKWMTCLYTSIIIYHFSSAVFIVLGQVLKHHMEDPGPAMAVALLWPLQHLSWLTGADRVWTRRDLGFSADLVRQELETSCADRFSSTTYIDYIVPVCDVLGNVWDLYGFMSDLLSFCILHMPVEYSSNNDDPMLNFDPCSAARICMKLCQDLPQKTCPAIGTRYFGAGAQKIRGTSAHVPRHAQTYCVAQPSLCHVQHPRRPQTIIPTMMSEVTTWWFCWGA